MRAFLILLFSLSAHADDIDAFEELLGATDVNAAIGNGGATAGLSAQGELTVLRWPSPSYFQHADFSTANGMNPRSLPHFGARDNQGSFAGVYVSPGPGGAPAFLWARDSGWTAAQRYQADDSNQLVTELHHAAARITVRYTDVVPDDLDVLVRHIEVVPDAGFSPAELRLVYFENFSPTLEKIDFFPTDQTNLLQQRDYALAYSAAQTALVHFSIADRPLDRVATLGSAKTPQDVDAFLSTWSDSGMYLLVGGDRAPDGYQCGWDADATPPTDAYLDAQNTMGALSSSPSVLQHADGALSWNLPASGGAVDVFIAMGGTLADAESALSTARSRGGAALRANDLAFWSKWLAPAAMPNTTDANRLRLARRALLSIAVGRDKKTGAIVASIASQPPYNLDWPRDGAFIDYALDVAGYHDWAEQHRHFYAQVQRQHDGDDTNGGHDAFAGSFAMNYYADGRPGGPIPLEIDQVGLTLWLWYEHAKWIDGKAAYLDSIWTQVARAADMLTNCVDPKNGLQCAENEDDDLDDTQTLHGAIPVWLGLSSAARAANFRHHDDQARRWAHRADALAAAIEKNFGDPQLGYVGGGTNLGDVGAIGPVAWTLWPAHFHPLDDARMKLAAQQIVDSYTPFFTQSNAGGSYFGKGLVALALAGRPEANGWIDLMVNQVPTSTGHYGESFRYDGNGMYTNVVSIPHLWEGTLTYLALMAAYSPDKFSKPELASAAAPADCGCHVGGAPAGSPLLLLAIVIAVSALRRRRN
jgi:MYXO-CTERM domain-containing protein